MRRHAPAAPLGPDVPGGPGRPTAPPLRLGLLLPTNTYYYYYYYSDVIDGVRGTTQVHTIDRPFRPRSLVEEVLGAAADVRDRAVTAVLGHADPVAVDVLAHLGRIGSSVPDDVSLLSYDDALFSHTETQISAMSPRRRWIGRRACELLVARLRSQGRLTPNPTRVPPAVPRRAA